MPMVRSPCTLEWPRTGQVPAPSLAMLPLMSNKFTTSLIVSTAFLCCVRPIAQQAMILVLSLSAATVSSICQRLRPVCSIKLSSDCASIFCFQASKPWVLLAMKFWSRTVPGAFSSSASNNFSMACIKAMSPLSFTCKKISVSRALIPNAPFTDCGSENAISPVSGKGLIEMMVAPHSLAFCNALSMRGWLVPGF